MTINLDLLWLETVCTYSREPVRCHVLDVKTILVHISPLLQSQVFGVYIRHGGGLVASLPLRILEARVRWPVEQLPTSPFTQLAE